MKKPTIINGVLLLAAAVLLTQCANYQRWPGYERQTEDELVELQGTIGNGVASGELTTSEADYLLGRLDTIRSDYNRYRGEFSTRENWEGLLLRLDALEEEVDAAMTDADRETLGQLQIEDKLFDLQHRIDFGLRAGSLTHTEARVLQPRLDSIRLDYLDQAPAALSTDEKRDLFARLEAVEADIEVATGNPPGSGNSPGYSPALDQRIRDVQNRIDREAASSTQRRRYQVRLDAIRTDLVAMSRDGGPTAEERERLHARLHAIEEDLDARL